MQIHQLPEGLEHQDPQVEPDPSSFADLSGICPGGSN